MSLDSLVEAQAGWLSEERAILTKEALVDGKSSGVLNQTPDLLQWKENLEILSAVDPARIGRGGEYQLQRNADPSSNLTLQIYRFGEGGPLREFDIYTDESGRLKRLRVYCRQSSSIDYSDRIVEMDFDERSGVDLLTSYSVTGVTKIVMKDSVRYRLAGRIDWPR